MIIECKNCLAKFTVNDAAIPVKGRMVQCGNCSTKWHQERILPYDKKKIPSPKIKINDEPDQKIQEYYGKKYTFLGNQWAEVLPSGKAGRLAKKNIGLELDKRIGRERQTKVEAKSEVNEFFSETPKKSMGVFSFLIVFIMFIAAIILLLDTFKNLIVPFWPKLDDYLIYIFETLNNIYIIIKDIFNNYK